MKSREQLISLSVALLSLLAWGRFAGAAIDKGPLKVGFIMVESVSDYGWNWAHDQGRLFMESKLPNQVKTSVAENVPESAEVERVMEKMIAQGNKLIFATSYGYLEPAWRVAARHPDVIIMHCGRPNPHPMKNIGSYGICFGNHYNPDYVAGVVAGRMTKTNEIGYVAAHPVPPLLLTINALALGARSVNPKVKVHVVWTNSWHDSPTEAEAAKGLIDKGVDVLAAHVDSTVTVVQTAEKNHIYSVGYHADVHHLAPKGWLTGNRLEWGPLYVRIAKSVLDHTWEPGDEKCSSKDEYGKLSSFGPAVPKAVQKEATDLLSKIEQGKFVVFKGPMKDRDGKERLAAGQIADNGYLGKIDWLVPGVEGSVPKK
jgi:basic membrane protein A